jgi:hypothetical protein
MAISEIFTNYDPMDYDPMGYYSGSFLLVYFSGILFVGLFIWWVGRNDR